MTAVVLLDRPASVRDEALPRPPHPAWLVSPGFDALFVANIGWPLLFAALWLFGPDLHDGVRFWQVYFVTAAHRWITLPLVFLDRDRFRERPRTFVAVAVATVIACVGVWLATGTLTCLLTIDYLWNAWHFASQHAGILRIYERQSGAAPRGARLEKLLVRGFLLYVILRMSGLEWSLLGSWLAGLVPAGTVWNAARLDAVLGVIDWISLAAPLALTAIVWPRRSTASAGRRLYFASCLSLYLAILAAAHWHRGDLMVLLASASALFHATEYLAVVSWAVQKRHSKGRSSSRNLIASLAPRWGLAVASFAVGLAVIGWASDQRTLEGWLLLNVIAAFLHYAYDGLIWRHRPPRSERR